VTEVVGTQFDLKYRSRKMNLVVTQGAVKTYREHSDNIVSVPKGEMVTYNTAHGFSSPVKVDVHKYTAWRNNKLSFVQAPLVEVMNEIENFYNVQVSYKNRFIKNKTLTGIFDTDSLDRILSMISLTMEMDIKREGKVIVVR
jgi:ferric-dicitrate binding protein FerR (iron transport regulator)